MPDEPEEGFTIRDRRRFHTEDEEVAPEEAAAAKGSSAVGGSDWSDAEAGGLPEQEDYESGLPDVYSVLALFLGELRNLAWMRMGLVANPGTNKIERDLPQAKIAIDTVSFLASQLEPVVAPEERLPLRAMVSDLQVNFVEQSKRAS